MRPGLSGSYSETRRCSRPGCSSSDSAVPVVSPVATVATTTVATTTVATADTTGSGATVATANATAVSIPPTGTGLLEPLLCEHTGPGTDYAVGPGQTYAAIGDVPWAKLTAGDSVRIFWRDEPYTKSS